MLKNFHSYHIVSVSPWPLLMGFGIMMSMIGLVKMFTCMKMNLFLGSLFFIIFLIVLWWRDVIRESTFQGCHTSMVIKGLMIGMLLFIVSEIFFFFSFFWAFFHSSLSPTVELGVMWPPQGIFPFNPFQIPMLNTVILLSSGISVTWAHQSILNSDWLGAKNSLCMTWSLGIYFLCLQWFEYNMATFSICDSVYGSTFFMSTGFHGFHVIIGMLFLFTIWIRLIYNHFSMKHHFGFEAAAWYWHFVDVVWLFLFSVVYWWGT